jgi:thiamine biosynthesis lipoprotein
MSPRQVHVEHVMGTAVSFDVRDETIAGPAIDEACRWLQRVDVVYSPYRRDSVISRLARGELRRPDVDPEVRAVLRRCEDLGRATGGAFDLHATGQLDPSGYVKGWATAHAGDILTRHGLEHWMINAGGDIVARGHADPRCPGGWRIGIRHPGDAGAFAAVAVLRDAAVATSARYERGDHVPMRGQGRRLDSVTVVARDLGTADAWATAILAGGEETLQLAARTGDLETFAIVGEQTLCTPAFPIDQTAETEADQPALICGS